MKKAAAALVPLLLATTPLAASDPTQYDIVIRNGRVLDGAGNPWIRADVAIKDGRIAKVGLIPGKGVKEIDAHDRYVTPGFVDMMDQSAEILLRSGAAENKIRQGVTTLIAGEGGTPVPAEQISGYFDQLEKQGIAVNFAIYYSAMQARRKIMGDVAGKPTAAQLTAMSKDVKTAMNAGVLGLSSALMYAPESFQSTEDLITLAKVVGQCSGFYATHMRDESEKLIPAIQEAIRIGEEGGVKVEIFHLKAAYRPLAGQLMPQALATINAARARGVDVAADMYVYPAASSGLEITVPKWMWAQGFAKGYVQLKDPAVREKLKKEGAAGSEDGWANPVAAAGGWDNVVLADAFNPKYNDYAGMSFTAIGAKLGQDPADVAWDILLGALPNRARAVYYVMDERDVELALRQPWVGIGSDASASVVAGKLDSPGMPHPRGYGATARVIGEYVNKKNVLTLEDAVRKLTSWPAQRMGFTDRGLLREGMHADVLVFDPAKFTDRSTFKEPLLLATGMDDVIVNGKLSLDEGKLTDARGGVVLRHECTLP
jgi:N-acyl-D-amino-acid deacylase